MSRRPLVILVPAGAVLFTSAWIVLGLISPGYELFGQTIAPYSWVSQPVSGLGLGVTGPWMNAAFITSGALILGGMLSSAPDWPGPLRRTAFVLMSLMGVGMIVCGVFTLESMMLHLVGFLLAVPLPAVGLVLAGIAWRRHDRTFASIALVCGGIGLVLFVAFQLTFDATGAGGNSGISGALQRALIVTVMTGVSAVVLLVARRTQPSPEVAASLSR